MRPSERRREVVLVGGGHAHVQVLRALAERPVDGVRVTLVVDTPIAVYSGMVPAYIAGEVPRHALEIDVVPLARRAGAAIVLAPCVRVGPGAIEVAGRPPVPYDVASLNLGSTVNGAARPDVIAHAIASRPIRALLDRFDAAMATLLAGPRRRLRLVTVGGGAGGLELLCCATGRLRRAGFEVDPTLISSTLPAWAASAGVRRVVERALTARGVRLISGVRAEGVEAGAVTLDDGVRLEADLIFWATGPAAHAVAAESGLPVDARGFIRVDRHLRVEGHDGLFAVGDCAVSVDAPWTPRAGVYAVRQGPVLADNLRALLTGAPLRPFRPQRDFLSMLNLGDGRATVAKWGMAAEGAWVHRWKASIDARFMDMFQPLDADGEPKPGMAPMVDDAMFCGGCAAKVGPDALEAVLCALPPVPLTPEVVLGVDAREDVASVIWGDRELLATVDGFVAFTDDPWLTGLAAAHNATSDVWSKGGRPRHALCQVVVPHDADGAALAGQVLAGVRTALDADGVTLIGGQTTLGAELAVSLTVLGDAERPLWRQRGARAGDRLVLTRPLGFGVLWRADRMGLARGAWVEAALEAVVRGQRGAAEVAARFDVRAATDITGFGLVGHARGLVRDTALDLHLDAAAVPRLPGVDGLLSRGLRSTAHAANRAISGWSWRGEPGPASAEVVFDPATSGGMVVAVAEADADRLVAALRAAGEDGAAVVGRFVDGDGRVWVG